MAVISISLHNLLKIANPVWLPDNLENAFSTKGPNLHNKSTVLVSWVRDIPGKDKIKTKQDKVMMILLYNIKVPTNDWGVGLGIIRITKPN
jgi:hypothetical protein